MPPALAQTAATAQHGSEMVFQIPAGPLGEALAAFGHRTGELISYDTRLAVGRNTQGLSGNYTVSRGLTLLLSGTGLQARPLAQGGWLLQMVPDSQAPVVLDSVEVTGDVVPQDEVYRTAASVNYISRDDIERFRGTSVGDIFQGTPGVLVGENRNSGGLDVNIRGMQGQSRVPVTVDGARQETTVYRGYSGVASRTYVDPDLIGGIEVSKGPVAGAAGTGATGGLVAMRTIGVEDIIKDDSNWGVRLRGSLSGNSSAAPSAGTVGGVIGSGTTYHRNCAAASMCSGQYAMPDSFRNEDAPGRPGMLDPYGYAGSLALAWRSERMEWVAAYAKRRQGTYYAGKHGPSPSVYETVRSTPFYDMVRVDHDGVTRFYEGERILNSNNESESHLLKGKLWLTPEQSLELSYLRYHSEYGELMPSQLMWFTKIRQTENSEVTAQTATARYRWQPDEWDAVDLDARLWVTKSDSLNRNYASDEREVEDLGGWKLPAEPETYRRTGMDVSNTSRWQFLGDHTLAYGGAAQFEDMSTDNVGVAGSEATGRSGTRREYSIFLDWTWKPAPEWTLAYGLRYQNSHTRDDKTYTPIHYQCYLYYTDANGTPVCRSGAWEPDAMCGDVGCSYNYRTRNSGTTPVYSLTWEPGLAGVQFYARHAEALRMPSLFEATSGWSVAPSPELPLQAEHAVNREFGINLLRYGVFSDRDRLAAKISYFRNKTSNYLTRTMPNAWEPKDQDFVMRNIQGVKVRGFEASVDYDTGWIYGRLAGTKYTFIEVCHDGSYRREACNNYGVATSYFNDMIPPNWHASALLGTRWLDGKLDIGARLTLMGKRNATPEYNDDTKRAFNWPTLWHAYRLVDVYARYQFNDSVSVDFNIDNLTDRYYVDPLSLGMVPAPGRTARLGMTLNF